MMSRWLGLALVGTLGCHASMPPDVQEPVVVVQVQEPAPESTAAPAPPPPPPPVAAAPLTIGGVRPGMTVAQFRQVLGAEGRSQSYDSVRGLWVNAGYDPDRQLEFLVGFDEVLTYNAGLAPTVLPIWTVYVRNGAIAMFKLTKYVPGTGPVEAAGFPPSCFLTRDPKGIEETFGNAYVLENDDAHSQTTYHFLERGISVLVKDGQIAVMNVYEPVHGARAAQIKQTLRGEAHDEGP